MRPLIPLALMIGIASAAVTQAQSQQTYFVASNGTDISTCGRSSTTACRSISYAAQLAPEGSKILVGPGRYGDSNRNGVLGDPGDEIPCPNEGSVVCIGIGPMGPKRLTVQSTGGPHVTIIDGGGFATSTVALGTGTIFGGSGKGFSIVGAQLFGLWVKRGAMNVSVIGNIAYDNPDTGFSIDVPGGRTIIAENICRDAAIIGFNINVLGDGQVVVDNNVASNSGAGFLFTGGRGHQIWRNKATGNEVDGFVLSGADFFFSDNTATDNGFAGIVVGGGDDGGNHYLTRNTIVGNTGAGILIFQLIRSSRLHANNIFGNFGCGLDVQSTPPAPAINATNNYWGAPTGPGVDPADAVCVQANRAVVIPFSTRPFKMNH